MVRFIKAGDFLREVSQNPRLKFDLAWITFAGLAVPTALLMSLGLPEQYALPLMLVAILPFQYAVFCFLRWPKEARNPQQLAAPVDEDFALRLIDEVAEREGWSFRDWKEVRHEYLAEMEARGRADLTRDEIHDRFEALLRRRQLQQPELF